MIFPLCVVCLLISFVLTPYPCVRLQGIAQSVRDLFVRALASRIVAAPLSDGRVSSVTRGAAQAVVDARLSTGKDSVLTKEMVEPLQVFEIADSIHLFHSLCNVFLQFLCAHFCCVIFEVTAISL